MTAFETGRRPLAVADAPADGVPVTSAGKWRDGSQMPVPAGRPCAEAPLPFEGSWGREARSRIAVEKHVCD